MSKNISKEKAIFLIEQKLKSFKNIKNIATYENRYNEEYDILFDGTAAMLNELFGKDEGNEFKTKLQG